MKHENRFGEFIANLRKERGISQEQLSEGLCSPSMLCKFENGEREAEKLLQNRFLTRLGAVPENYENFLFYEEYCHWEKRQGILYNILKRIWHRRNCCWRSIGHVMIWTMLWNSSFILLCWHK